MCWRHQAPRKQQFGGSLEMHWADTSFTGRCCCLAHAQCGGSSLLVQSSSPPRQGEHQPHPVLVSPLGPPEEGPRVVFMVDLWHPNVAAAERQALDFIFAPGR